MNLKNSTDDNRKTTLPAISVHLSGVGKCVAKPGAKKPVNMRHLLQNPNNYAGLWHSLSWMDKINAIGISVIKMADHLPGGKVSNLEAENAMLRVKIANLEAQNEVLKDRIINLQNV